MHIDSQGRPNYVRGRKAETFRRKCPDPDLSRLNVCDELYLRRIVDSFQQTPRRPAGLSDHCATSQSSARQRKLTMLGRPSRIQRSGGLFAFHTTAREKHLRRAPPRQHVYLILFGIIRGNLLCVPRRHSGTDSQTVPVTECLVGRLFCDVTQHAPICCKLWNLDNELGE